ncbi:CDAN1-interacting nuclease 1-like [Liolophura sinensis]|uniref:CDAN1-interacting nuclease 1-like n=1 Tax=Liolophura sinensis TaxID=3198878 RepID=UPI003158985C
MEMSVYNDIIDCIHAFNSRKCLPKLVETYPGIPVNTLGSILSQDYQKKMKKCHHQRYSTSSVEKYYQRYLQDVSAGKECVILSLADEIDLSPALTARIILEKHLSVTKHDGQSASRSQVTQMMRDTTLIEDPVLAAEVHYCVLDDDHYGPLVDCIKHSVGHEYEFKLKRKLDSLDLAYIGEEEMRARGYDKTPDIKMEVPIAVNGHVVNWIESKASFGDEHSHKGYEKDQFWSYWNRFGPGMVIYWFGYIKELDVNREKGIMLMDDFPANIVTMDPLQR